jgi:hypothetical protein
MLFPNATLQHDASPLLRDQTPGQVHIVPTHDAKDHVVKLAEPCWCAPQTQDEGQGYSTLIHKPILPVVKGHTLAIKKILIGVKDGIAFVAELPER